MGTTIIGTSVRRRRTLPTLHQQPKAIMNHITRSLAALSLVIGLLSATVDAFATHGPPSSSIVRPFGVVVVAPTSPSTALLSRPQHFPLQTRPSKKDISIIISSWRSQSCSSSLSSTRGRVVLYMGWGPEPVWTEATVESVDKACESGASASVRIQVPSDTYQQYQHPGQYVQVRLDDGETKPLFLAMASSPPPPSQGNGNDENTPTKKGSPTTFEFLVKKTPTNDWITSAATAGAAVQVSQVLGSGFPVEENLEGFKYDFPTQNVLLFAAGSGIGPIRAAIESGRLGVGSGGRTARLYYGERTASDLCYVDHFTEWEALGYEVVPVLSQPDGSWKGRAGYVQTALEEDGVAIPRNSGALVVGMKGMAEAVKALLVSAGVFDGRVLFNF